MSRVGLLAIVRSDDDVDDDDDETRRANALHFLFARDSIPIYALIKSIAKSKIELNERNMRSKVVVVCARCSCPCIVNWCRHWNERFGGFFFVLSRYGVRMYACVHRCMHTCKRLTSIRAR